MTPIAVYRRIIPNAAVVATPTLINSYWFDQGDIASLSASVVEILPKHGLLGATSSFGTLYHGVDCSLDRNIPVGNTRPSH